MSSANKNSSPRWDNNDSHTEFIHHEDFSHPSFPQTKFSLKFDQFIRAIGSMASWIWVLLVGVIVLNVTMRYVFGEGRIEFEEIQWHFYSIGFLVGLSYCLESDDHVRVDLLYERFSLKTKAWVELGGMLFLLLPFLVLVIWYAIPFVEYSLSVNETSEAPGGLPARWGIKSMLLIGFMLLLAAALSRLSRVTACLFQWPKPIQKSLTGKEIGNGI